MLVTSTRETHLSGSTEQGEGHLVWRSPLFRGWGSGICVSHENYKNLLCRDPYEGFPPHPFGWLYCAGNEQFVHISYPTPQ